VRERLSPDSLSGSIQPRASPVAASELMCVMSGDLIVLAATSCSGRQSANSEDPDLFFGVTDRPPRFGSSMFPQRFLRIRLHVALRPEDGRTAQPSYPVINSTGPNSSSRAKMVEPFTCQPGRPQFAPAPSRYLRNGSRSAQVCVSAPAGDCRPVRPAHGLVVGLAGAIAVVVGTLVAADYRGVAARVPWVLGASRLGFNRSVGARRRSFVLLALWGRRDDPARAAVNDIRATQDRPSGVIPERWPVTNASP
jgi:hypothetical protein